MQNLIDEHKEVIEPALGQGRRDGRAAIAFAKPLILNMRMGDVVAARRRVRIECNNPIRLRPLADLIPIQPNLKVTQEDIFKFDRIRGDGQFLLLEVNIDGTEFALQGHEVEINRRSAYGHAMFGMLRDSPNGGFHCPLEMLAGFGQLAEQVLCGKMPTPLSRTGDAPLEGICGNPVMVWQVDGLRRRSLLG